MERLYFLYHNANLVGTSPTLEAATARARQLWQAGDAIRIESIAESTGSPQAVVTWEFDPVDGAVLQS